MSQPMLPPAAQMMNMLSSGWVSVALGVAATQNIPDLLRKGPRSAHDLATETGLHENALERILRMLAAEGVFAETERGIFALTPLGEVLCTDTPASLRNAAVMLAAPEHYSAWGALNHSLETGKPAFTKVFGKPFFEQMAEDSFASEIFNAAMSDFARQDHSAAATAYDFGQHPVVVDVGGGHGTLLTTILKKHPELRGIVYDLPHVVSGAANTFQEGGVADRAKALGGNFFEEIPSGGDAYIMSHIIHDWDGERCLTILRNIHRAMEAGGKLILFEQVLPPLATPCPSYRLDVNMLVMTEGGRERTAEEYGLLFKQAGFRLEKIIPTQTPMCIVSGAKH